MKNIATNKTAAKTAIAPQGTITFKKLSYKIAKQALDEEAGKTPRQWSMHPYCGGYIQALCHARIIDAKTADKLWAEFAIGI